MKDHERLGQERRKRGTGRNPTRRKRGTSGKDSRDSMPPLTSELYLPTDGMVGDGMTSEIGTEMGMEMGAEMGADIGADMSADMGTEIGAEMGETDVVTTEQLNSILEAADSQDFNGNKEAIATQTTASGRSGFSNAGSTQTEAMGTANSPIPVDPEQEDLGPTRRLLFPSPRQQKGHRDVLGTMSPNIITTAPAMDEAHKGPAADTAENNNEMPEDELESLFRSPGPARPSTPPPREQHSSGAKGAVLRTPSRLAATPTHRPITRSIAKSIRSVQSSPTISQLALLQTTPTRTPRAARLLVPESPSLRRSPRINGPASAAKNLRRAVDAIPGGDMDAALGALGTPIVDQANMDALLDRCLVDFHKGEWDDSRGWENLGEQDWEFDKLELEGLEVPEAEPEPVV